MKNNKYILFSLTGFYIIFLFILDFYIFETKSDYFWCVSFEYFEILNTYLPIHCDEGPYYEASQKLSFFFSENNPYQKRPLYILLITVIRRVLNIFAFGYLSEYFIFRLSMLFIQYIILFFIAVGTANLFRINRINFLSIITLFSIFSIPNVRWNIFYPSHGNLTLLLLIITLIKIFNNNKVIKNSKLFFLLMGILSLFHRTALVFGLIYLLFSIIKKKNENIKNYFFYIFNLLIPTFLYELIVRFSKYDSYDWNREVYGQFYWIIDILNGKQIEYHDTSCHQINLFLNCYFENTLHFLSYFMVLVIFSGVLCAYNLEILKDKFIGYLFGISTVIFIFWSLQGLYQTFRFINYSIGYFLFLTLIFINFKYFKDWILSLAIITYQFSIFYLEPYSITTLKPNNVTYFSIILFALFFFNQLTIKFKKTSNQKLKNLS